MKSLCYVVIPKNMDRNDINEFVKVQIKKYDINLEIEPYKKFFTKEYTLESAKRHGFENDLVAFSNYLMENKKDIGVEDGCLYFIVTNNNNGRWDYYTILKDTIKESEVEEVPYSLVALDGVWHSLSDFGYKPKLDFDNNIGTHKDNVEPLQRWKEFVKGIIDDLKDLSILVLEVHS